MSSIVLSGDTSGTITLDAPAVAGTNTILFPANTGTVITTASSGQVIPKAALPTGSVLQVVQATTTTYVTANSTTYVDTTLSASITPSSTSNKVLVLINQAIGTSGAGNVGGIRLVRNSTDVQTWGFGVFYTGSSDLYGYSSNNYLDSPSSTSSVTYKTQINRQGGSGTTRVQYSDSNGSQISTITLLEIAA